MMFTTPEKQLPETFHRLCWRDLRAVADYHDAMARELRRRADRLQKIDAMQADCAAQVDQLADSYKTVLAYIAKGYNSADSAIAAAARDLGLPEHTVAGWWRVFIQNRDRRHREERNSAILKLVQLGMTNEDIAQRFGVHENTVSRAISDSLSGPLPPTYRRSLKKPPRSSRRGFSSVTDPVRVSGSASSNPPQHEG